MNKAFAISKAKGAGKLAALLGITPSAVSMWGPTVPPARVWQLQALRPRWVAQWKRESKGRL